VNALQAQSYEGFSRNQGIAVPAELQELLDANCS